MEEEKPSKESESKPTPQLLLTMNEIDEALKGVDFWEIDKPPK